GANFESLAAAYGGAKRSNPVGANEPIEGIGAAPWLEKTVGSLPDGGAAPEPIEVPDGYVVVRRVREVPPGPATFADVNERWRPSPPPSAPGTAARGSASWSTSGWRPGRSGCAPRRRSGFIGRSSGLSSADARGERPCGAPTRRVASQFLAFRLAVVPLPKG